jgi:SAM-dependent methyltransferase
MEPQYRVRDHLRPEVVTEFPVEWCDSCEYGRVAGEFTPGEVAAFYAAGYYTHGPETVGKQRMGLLNRLRMHLAWRLDGGRDLSPDELARLKEHPRLCDVGCGSGQAMAAFKQAGYEAVGIEPDPAARSIAAQNGEVFEGTAEALPAEIEGRQFDAVLLSHVLEHCIDPVAALGNVKSLLAPEGTAIIEVPNNDAAGLQMFGAGWFYADIPRHLQFFTEKSLRAALGRAGLRVTNTIYTGYMRQFSPEWQAAHEVIRARIGGGPGGAREGNLWELLLRTAFARERRKYDSIRVHAVHA